MKKVLITLLAVTVSVMGLFGCSTDQNKEEEIKYADEDFLKDFKAGLEARWDNSDQLEADQFYTEEHRKLYGDSVDTELNKIEKYENEKFEDSKLKEDALSYINALRDQKDALQYVTADPNKYDELWAAAYNKRAKLIEKMIKTYNVEFDEKHQNIVNDFLVQSQKVQKEEDLKEKLDALEVNFEQTEDNSGWKKYAAVVENTTGVDFDFFSFEVNLLDTDGVILQSQSATVQNWGNGQKARFEITTDQDFSSYETSYSYNIKEN